jgi:hypothetical protein
MNILIKRKERKPMEKVSLFKLNCFISEDGEYIEAEADYNVKLEEEGKWEEIKKEIDKCMEEITKIIAE